MHGVIKPACHLTTLHPFISFSFTGTWDSLYLKSTFEHPCSIFHNSMQMLFIFIHAVYHSKKQTFGVKCKQWRKLGKNILCIDYMFRNYTIMTSIHWAQFMCGCSTHGCGCEGVDFTLKAEKPSKNKLFLLNNMSQLSCNLSIWTNFSLSWIADHSDDVIQRQTPELLHRQWIIERLLQVLTADVRVLLVHAYVFWCTAGSLAFT